MAKITFIPISRSLRGIVPAEWVGDLDSFFGPLRIIYISDNSAGSDTSGEEDGQFRWDEEGLYLRERFALMIEGGIVIDMPLLTGSRLRIGSVEAAGMPMFGIETRLGDESSFRIFDLPLTLHFPRSMVRKYRKIEGSGLWVEVTTGLDNAEREDPGGYDLVWSPDLRIDKEGFRFSGAFDPLPPFMIGDTGVIIDLVDAEVILVTDEVPEALVEKVPADFKGLYLSRASVIYFKPSSTFDPKITLEEAAIGSGGFSGRIILGVPPESESNDVRFSAESLNALFSEESPRYASEEEREEGHSVTDSDGNRRNLFPVSLQDMKVVLEYFGIGFRQSVPEWGAIKGYIYMPFAEKWVSLKASLGGPNGDFMLEVGGAGDESLIELENDIFEISVESIAYQLKDNINYAIIDGGIRLKQPQLNWPQVKVEKLRIGSDGSIAFEGGWLRAPEQITLDLYGFKLGISEIGLGEEDRAGVRRQWFGFSGEVQLAEGLPIKGSVDGLKISWPKSGPGGTEVTLRGIGVEFTIPGTLEFSGSVSYDSATNLFKGHIRLNLIALRTEVEGTLMVGKYKDPVSGMEYSVFYIHLSATLPTAIPLGATGTGLYGLEGLFGMNVAPTKTREQQWYEWYKAAPARNITSLQKWQPQFDNYAFGLGIQLGTIYDDGTTLNMNALLVVLIPGPVIILEGKANLLQPRGDKSLEGAFYLLAVLDCRAGTFQLVIDIRFSLEDIIVVGGGLEAFFDFNNDQNWYLYIGRKEPEEKRIRAEILSIFSANTYFMIDPRALQLGASVGININESWGPVSLRIIARISVDAAIYFKPFQLEGRLQMLVDIGVSIFGIGLRLYLELLLEGKVPNPLYIYGRGRLGIGLPWPLPSFDVTVEFKWEEDRDTPIPSPLLKRAELLAGATEGEVQAFMVHHKSTDLNIRLGKTQDDAPTVPLDCRPQLTFAKKLHAIGETWLNSQPDAVGKRNFTYRLSSLSLVEIRADGMDGETVLSGINEDRAINPRSFSIITDGGGGTSSSFINGLDAQEPVIELWKHEAWDRKHSYARETVANSEPPCAPEPEYEYETIDWRYAEPGPWPLRFAHEGLQFEADYVPEATLVAKPDGSQTTVKYPLPLPCVARFGLNQTQFHYCLRTTSLSIYLPELGRMARLKILLGYQPPLDDRGDIGRITVTAWHRGNQIGKLSMRQYVENSIPTLEFSTPGTGWVFDFLRIEEPLSTDKAFWLDSITWLPEAVFASEQMVPGGSRVPGGDNAPQSELNNVPTLKPGTLYRLRVGTAIIDRGATVFTQDKDLFFRTDRGPGIPDEGISYADNPVHRLETYISETYPAHGARNHYMNYDIGIGFNQSYVSKLYQQPLAIRFRDRNGTLIGEGDGSWLNGFVPLLSVGTLTWLLGKENGGCGGGNAPGAFAPLLSIAAPADLKPQTLYFAEVYTKGRSIEGGVETEFSLHQFQFTTSRYANFRSHVLGAFPELWKNLGAPPPQFNVHVIPPVALPALTGEAADAASIFRLDTAGNLAIKLEVVTAKQQSLGLKTRLGEAAKGTSPMGALALYRTVETAQTVVESTNTRIQGSFEKIDRVIGQSFDSIGMRERGLPLNLEFIKIPVTGARFCLVLVESPEPMEWQRISGVMALGDPSGRTDNIAFVHNEDKTRAFLLLNDSLGIPSGNYTVLWKFSGTPDFESGLYRRSNSIYEDERVTFRISV